MISEDFLALANEVLSRAKATGPNPTSQRALEHILSEMLSLRTSPPPSGEAGEVKVKPLVWEREESDWWVAQPPGMIGGGGYEVRLTSAGRVRARCGTEDWYYFDGTADQAKAAFQSDYETRIRSALLPTIKEPTDG
jgi:hypothetical protein